MANLLSVECISCGLCIQKSGEDFTSCQKCTGSACTACIRRSIDVVDLGFQLQCSVCRDCHDEVQRIGTVVFDFQLKSQMTQPDNTCELCPVDTKQGNGCQSFIRCPYCEKTVCTGKHTNTITHGRFAGTALCMVCHKDYEARYIDAAINSTLEEFLNVQFKGEGDRSISLMQILNPAAGAKMFVGSALSVCREIASGMFETSHFGFVKSNEFSGKVVDFGLSYVFSDTPYLLTSGEDGSAPRIADAPSTDAHDAEGSVGHGGESVDNAAGDEHTAEEDNGDLDALGKTLRDLSRCKDKYEVLGLSKKDVSDEAVKSAYNKKLLDVHPDKHGNDVRAKEAFMVVVDAYVSIKSRSDRKSYDASLEAKESQQAKPFVPRTRSQIATATVTKAAVGGAAGIVGATVAFYVGSFAGFAGGVHAVGKHLVDHAAPKADLDAAVVKSAEAARREFLKREQGMRTMYILGPAAGTRWVKGDRTTPQRLSWRCIGFSDTLAETAVLTVSAKGPTGGWNELGKVPAVEVQGIRAGGFDFPDFRLPDDTAPGTWTYRVACPDSKAQVESQDVKVEVLNPSLSLDVKVADEPKRPFPGADVEVVCQFPMGVDPSLFSYVVVLRMEDGKVEQLVSRHAGKGVLDLVKLPAVVPPGRHTLHVRANFIDSPLASPVEATVSVLINKLDVAPPTEATCIGSLDRQAWRVGYPHALHWLAPKGAKRFKLFRSVDGYLFRTWKPLERTVWITQEGEMTEEEPGVFVEDKQQHVTCQPRGDTHNEWQCHWTPPFELEGQSFCLRVEVLDDVVATPSESETFKVDLLEVEVPQLGGEAKQVTRTQQVEVQWLLNGRLLVDVDLFSVGLTSSYVCSLAQGFLGNSFTWVVPGDMSPGHYFIRVRHDNSNNWDSPTFEIR